MIKKVPGGYQVDGLDLICGQGGSSGVARPGYNCCPTYSTVRHEDHIIAFFAKAITPHTRDNYEWGYRVKKGGLEVDVLVYDTRHHQNFTFEGHYPPPVSAWLERGWELISQFERPLESSPENSN
ncbi:MAG: hypothetical protein ACLFUU_12170 [Desulfobacteraceae bacterium]